MIVLFPVPPKGELQLALSIGILIRHNIKEKVVATTY